MDVVGKQLMKAQAKSIKTDLFGDDDRTPDSKSSREAVKKEKERRKHEEQARAERQAQRRSVDRQRQQGLLKVQASPQGTRPEEGRDKALKLMTRAGRKD
ncbi:hypothetical protein PTSG_00857 [Salpingoeca rosetta]|uniref:Uncharacterized protein n=1 Tax=Salpingoeca rosetta (strain ATCC 50818 / BSB-021) TaxID=946362 RepID=F2TXP2_SALR5|nr:uncharacterized protein PTSG_00857 [Salpingoeca rosetta]EGD76151.1 hypothetical protein PTSG_00857 [Salpingoeca rosetta]|eukprot:XP_004998326.1 hypothetical protein PTSG_00857 [Salpingoeca rosetta]